MKKRIIATFISVVIVSLSVLTAFSGCSGESYPKLVANRDEFFSEVAGRYGNRDSTIYIFEDGTFQINYNDTNLSGGLMATYNGELIPPELHPRALYQFSGSLKTVYQDSEIYYRVNVSTLKKSLKVLSIDNREPVFNYGENIEVELWDYNCFNSNDIIYIYVPGTPISELPIREDRMGIIEIINYDKDSDEKLDNYLLVNYTKNFFVTCYKEEDYITNGVWIDYGLNDSAIDVYDFDYYAVNVSRYDLTEGKSEKIALSIDGIKPINYATSGNRVILFFDNGKANVISPTNDINKMKCYTEATDSKAKSPHMLYHYDKLPGHDVLVKDAAAARSGNTKN